LFTADLRVHREQPVIDRSWEGRDRRRVFAMVRRASRQAITAVRTRAE
jgi:hypothetical protein